MENHEHYDAGRSGGAGDMSNLHYSLGVLNRHQEQFAAEQAREQSERQAREARDLAERQERQARELAERHEEEARARRRSAQGRAAFSNAGTDTGNSGVTENDWRPKYMPLEDSPWYEPPWHEGWRGKVLWCIIFAIVAFVWVHFKFHL